MNGRRNIVFTHVLKQGCYQAEVYKAEQAAAQKAKPKQTGRGKPPKQPQNKVEYPKHGMLFCFVFIALNTNTHSRHSHAQAYSHTHVRLDSGLLWICLTCARVDCGRSASGHAEEHSKAQKHHICSKYIVVVYGCVRFVRVRDDVLREYV